MSALRWRLAQSRILRPALGAVLSVGLLVSVSGCDISPRQPLEREFVIAGGGTSGVYYNYGKHLAEILSRDLDERFTVAETDGSVDNLRRIGSGQALIGFAQSDAAGDALTGVGMFDERIPIRAVARLYDEYVHVVVRQDSDLKTLQDLAGRPVSLGARSSGVNLVAMRVLASAGVDAASVTNLELGPDASIAALKSGQIDAFFWVGGVPTPGLERLAADTPVRLLAVDAETVAQLNNEYNGAYRISEFPLGSYGWETPTLTMTVPNYLVVAKGASPDLVERVTERLFAARSELAQKVPTAALLDRRQAIFTYPIELHSGAEKYYIRTKK